MYSSGLKHTITFLSKKILTLPSCAPFSFAPQCGRLEQYTVKSAYIGLLDCQLSVKISRLSVNFDRSFNISSEDFRSTFLSYIIYHISYIIYRISYIVYRISYIVYRISYIVYRISYIIYHISYIIYHISYIIYHISYIIYHISYIIYHISYIIYHISYIICHMYVICMSYVCHMSYVIYHTMSCHVMSYHHIIFVPNRTILVHFGGISGAFGGAMVCILARRIYPYVARIS